MAPAIYQAIDPAELTPPVELESFVAVYHRRSGATHLLCEPAPEILDILRQGDADAATVRARLDHLYGLEADDGGEIAAVVEARLDELAALGLVRRL